MGLLPGVGTIGIVASRSDKKKARAASRERRPPIGPELARRVRQRCGFGCVVCGDALFDLHHEPPYNEERGHREEDLICLCDKHHRRAGTTPPLLTREEVLEWNANPWCQREGATKPEACRFGGDEFRMRFGSFSFVAEEARGGMTVFELAGKPVLALTFRNGRPVLTLELYNKLRRRVLHIDENQLSFRADNYDVEWKDNLITVRTGFRQPILLELALVPPSEIHIRKGFLSYRCGSHRDVDARHFS